MSVAGFTGASQIFRIPWCRFCRCFSRVCSLVCEGNTASVVCRGAASEISRRSVTSNHPRAFSFSSSLCSPSPFPAWSLQRSFLASLQAHNLHPLQIHPEEHANDFIITVSLRTPSLSFPPSLPFPIPLSFSFVTRVTACLFAPSLRYLLQLYSLSFSSSIPCSLVICRILRTLSSASLCTSFL